MVGWYGAVLSERRLNPNWGCGEWYYTCKDADKHELREADGCKCPYRNCLKPVRHVHNNDDAQGSLSPSISPSNGSYYASSGHSHTSDFTTSSVYSVVFWYVKSPSESGLGTNVETDYGDGSSMTASMTYTFPSGVFGDYVITAYVYDGDGTTIYETSYTVSVSDN